MKASHRAIALRAIFVCIFAAVNISAATLIVTKTEDTNDGVCDADCSLREAVAAANPDDTVVFSSLFNTPQTITLALGNIAITRTLTISGPGAERLTISGNNASRIFRITGVIIVNLSDFRIANGRASSSGDEQGGGIYVLNSSLALRHLSIVNNRAATSHPDSSYGGGIFLSGGTLMIIDSTISGNRADGGGGGIGGGIWSNGTVYVLDSSIVNNDGSRGGGGIYDMGGTLYLTNSSVSGNSSFYLGFGTCIGGGIHNENSAGRVTLTNSTITNNASYVGGGICNRGTAVARNSIIARNAASPERDFSGSVVSDGFNLIGDTDGSSGWTTTDLQNIDPLLAALGNNGGPTPTHAILPSSPAINAGNNDLARDPFDTTPLLYDQRGNGFARVVGGTVDIGAYEANYAGGLVTVGGRVTTGGGRGVANVRVTLTDGGTTLFAQTNPFGYYRFANLTPGTTYAVALMHKYYMFDPPQYVTIDQNRSDLNFIAQ
jgi:CSLREA domain-containing protein